MSARNIVKVLLLFFGLSSFSTLAQDIDSHSPRPNAGTIQQRKADKKKLKQQKKIELGNERGRKRHLKLQAKNTRKMMRKSKRTSKKWNEN